MWCSVLFYLGVLSFSYGISCDVTWLNPITLHSTHLSAYLCCSVSLYLAFCVCVCVGWGFRWMSPERRGRIRGSTTEGCMRRRLPNSTGNLRGPPGTQQQQKHTLSHCHPEAKLGIAQSCELFKRLSCQQYRSDSCDSLTLSNWWKIIKTRMQFVFTLLQK